MNVVLLGAGSSTCLTLHNLKAYVQTDACLKDRVKIHVCDYENSLFPSNFLDTYHSFRTTEIYDKRILDILHRRPEGDGRRSPDTRWRRNLNVAAVSSNQTVDRLPRPPGWSCVEHLVCHRLAVDDMKSVSESHPTGQATALNVPGQAISGSS